MKKQLFHIMLLMLLVQPALAQQKDNSRTVWNGYTQLRFSSDFDDVNTFAMRRMKLWVRSTPEFSENWGYRVQSTISSNQDKKFLLQDVYAFYQDGRFRINMGQFVPRYSLQRFQPDFEMPLTERSDVINALIPNGTLGVRDIGVEGNYENKNKTIKTWLGIFNGYGIKEYRFENRGIMLSHKTQATLFQKYLQIGYSVMYRKADQLQLSKVLPDTMTFLGSMALLSDAVHNFGNR